MDNIPTMLVAASIYFVIFIYGIAIGSFANVVTLRIPRKEGFVKTRSHCDSCGYILQWYDLIPILSFVLLRGKCRKCKTKISAQHLVMEVLNGIFYVGIVYVVGFTLDAILICILCSTLLTLSVIDFKTYEIPVGFQWVIFGLSVCRLVLYPTMIWDRIIGFFAVSLVLLLLYLISKGAAIGGGDVKLMAVAGLFMGWKCIILAFVLGCIIGSVIHILRMKISGEGKVLAMGPYLSVGIMIAVLYGNKILDWYLGFYRMN